MSWQPLNLAAPEFATRTRRPDHVGLIYSGRRHLLSGPPESLKTLLAWIIARAVVRAGGVVACVDFEQGPNITRELLENLGWTLDEIRTVYYVEPDTPPDNLQELIDAGVTLTIIDSAPGAFDAAALDDNSRKDAEKFARTWIEPLYRRAIATLLIDHVTKNAENRGKYAIGSERKVDGVDVHLGVEVVTPLARGGNGLVKVRVHKDRPGHLRRPYTTEIALHSDPLTHAIGWTFREPAGIGAHDNGWKPTELMEKISRWLEEQTEPRSKNQIESANLGRQASYVRQAMDALIAEGYVTVSKGPRNSHLLTSTLPFRTSSDLVPTSSDELSPTSSSSSTAYRRDEVTDEDEVGWLSDEDIPFSDHEPEHEDAVA